MPRTWRRRTRSRTHTGYSWYPVIHGVRQSPPTVSERVTTDIIEDYVGRPVQDSPLYAEKWSEEIGRINGRFESAYLGSGIGNEYENSPHIFSFNLGPMQGFIEPPSGWYLDVVSRTNPARPTISSPPQMLQDLLDLPSMLRQLARLMLRPRTILTPRGAANAHLATVFGWMPFVQDILKLLDLQSYVLRRIRELKSLYGLERGLRRRLPMGDSSDYREQMITLAGYGNATVYIPVGITVKRRAWATITWYPLTLPPFHPNDVRWNSHARRIVLGFTDEGIARGLWDVIPWTWLIGWFTNISRYIGLYGNTVPARHSKACFCTTYQIRATYGTPRAIGCSYSNITATGTPTITYRKRYVSGALTPGFSIPFLDMQRLAILGSLTIQRVVR